MSDISVTVTNAGAANVSVSGGSTVNATVGNGGTVSVGIGSISPGNATVVSGTLTINSTTTLAAGSNATVTNKGTAYAAVLDFGIPAGATGPQGPQGPAGQNGINGITPTFTASALTLAAGSSATVTATPSNGGANVALEFGIPRGDPGTGGGSNLTLSDGTPSALGTASAGTSSLASRADHVHALPTISYANLSDVPTNFPSNIASVSGLQAALDGKQAAGNYVTSVNNLTGSLTLAAGANVTITPSGSTLTIAASGGGLGENDAVDGGLYAGEILYGITFTTQPQSQTVSSSTTVGNWVSLPTGSNNFPASSGFVWAAAVSSANAVAFFRPRPNILGLQAATSENGSQWTLISGGSASSANYPTLTGLAAFVYGDTATTVQSWFNAATDVSFSQLSSVNIAGGTVSVFNDITGYGGGCLLRNSQTHCRVASDGRFRRSSDLANWSAQGTIKELEWYGATNDFTVFSGVTFLDTFLVHAGGQLSVSGGELPAGRLYRSVDGSAWTVPVATGLRVFPWFDKNFATLAVSTSVAVALGSALNTAYYSTNGTSWTLVTLPRNAVRLFWSGTRFVAFDGSETNEYIWSVNGATWNVATLPASRVWKVSAGSASAIVVHDTNSLNESSYYASVATAPASANLTVSATAASGNPVSYQWQSSLDAGTTWASINGATSNSLNLTGITIVDSGTRFRAQASATGAATKTSQSATLTVTE